MYIYKGGKQSCGWFPDTGSSHTQTSASLSSKVPWRAVSCRDVSRFPSSGGSTPPGAAVLISLVLLTLPAVWAWLLVPFPALTVRQSAQFAFGPTGTLCLAYSLLFFLLTHIKSLSTPTGSVTLSPPPRGRLHSLHPHGVGTSICGLHHVSPLQKPGGRQTGRFLCAFCLLQHDYPDTSQTLYSFSLIK